VLENIKLLKRKLIINMPPKKIPVMKGNKTPRKTRVKTIINLYFIFKFII